MKHKSIGAQIKDIDDRKGIVDMYWSAFGNEDADGDIIRRGAYANTIREWGPAGENRVKFLWQHKRDEPIGRPLELTEDAQGLRAVVKIAPTTRGRDALILYEESVITEHSVGIDVLKRDRSDRRVITETRLWEGSAVTFAANSSTPVLGMKAANEYAVRKALKRGLSDDTAKALEYALNPEWADVLQTIDELNAAFRSIR